jgi:hypothetical protein
MIKKEKTIMLTVEICKKCIALENEICNDKNCLFFNKKKKEIIFFLDSLFLKFGSYIECYRKCYAEQSCKECHYSNICYCEFNKNNEFKCKYHNENCDVCTCK